MARPTALRRIACHIEKIAFLLALGTLVWWASGSDKKSALPTFPEGLIALRADVSGKFTVSGITAMSALPFVRLVFHFLHLPFSSLTSILIATPFRFGLRGPGSSVSISEK